MFCLDGQTNDDEGLKPYFMRRNELSCDQGCLLQSLGVVIRSKFHWEHPIACVRSMKAIARSYVW